MSDHRYGNATSPSYNESLCSSCRQQCVASCLCPNTCTPVIKDATKCLLAKGRWESARAAMGFDNLSQAFFTLFQIITTEGWVAIMLTCTDSVAPYMNPARDANEVWAVFFMMYTMTG